MDYPNRDDLLNGKFTDGDPANGIPASRDNAAQMNAVYDELRALIMAGGIAPDSEDLTQVAQSVGHQLRSKGLFDVSGGTNAIVLTTPAGKQPVKALNNYDEFSFIATATNTDTMTVVVDGLAAKPLTNVSAAHQVFNTALVTIRYLAGAFYLVEQTNLKTGNNVLDIGKLVIDTTDVLRPGEYSLDGSELSRADHPIAWAIISATSNLIDQSKKNADQQTYAGYYGTGNGSTTFTLPIVGGEFIRMFDDGRGVDKGRVFGGWSDDELKSHRHGILAADVYKETAFVLNDNSGDLIVSSDNIANGINATVHPGRYFTEYAGSSETRPRSIAFYGKTRL